MHGYSDLLQALTGEHLSPVGSLSTKVTLISASAVLYCGGSNRTRGCNWWGGVREGGAFDLIHVTVLTNQTSFGDFI